MPARAAPLGEEIYNEKSHHSTDHRPKGGAPMKIGLDVEVYQLVYQVSE